MRVSLLVSSLALMSSYSSMVVTRPQNKRQRTLHNGALLPTYPFSHDNLTDAPPIIDSVTSPQVFEIINARPKEQHPSQKRLRSINSFRSAKNSLTREVSVILQRPTLNFNSSTDKFATARKAIRLMNSYLALPKSELVDQSLPSLIDKQLSTAHTYTLRALMNSYQIEIVKMTGVDPTAVEDVSMMMSQTFLLWNQLSEIIFEVKQMDAMHEGDVLGLVANSRLVKIGMLLDEFVANGIEMLYLSRLFIISAVNGVIDESAHDGLKKEQAEWLIKASTTFSYIRDVFYMTE